MAYAQGKNQGVVYGDHRIFVFLSLRLMLGEPAGMKEKKMSNGICGWFGLATSKNGKFSRFLGGV